MEMSRQVDLRLFIEIGTLSLCESPPLNILLGAPVKAHGAPNNLRTLPVYIYRGGEVLVCIVYIIHIHRYVTCMSTWIASPPCEWKRMKTESDSPAHDHRQVNTQCNVHQSPITNYHCRLTAATSIIVILYSLEGGGSEWTRVVKLRLDFDSAI